MDGLLLTAAEAKLLRELIAHGRIEPVGWSDAERAVIARLFTVPDDLDRLIERINREVPATRGVVSGIRPHLPMTPEQDRQAREMALSLGPPPLLTPPAPELVRLCDDDGMVSDTPVEPGSQGTEFDPELTYLKRANNLRAHTGHPPVEEFHCTGSMHAAGMVFACTSPAHDVGVIEPPGIILDPPKPANYHPFA